MPTILITGANRGLGLEFTKRYAEDGWNVIACCRNPSEASELQALAQKNSTIRAEALDVLSASSIEALSTKLQNTAIDILLNNAGVYSGSSSKASAVTGDKSQEFGTIDGNAWEKVLRANTIAPIMILQAFTPHLKKGSGKKIINITSRMGSIGTMKTGAVAYRSSKAALNAAMRAILQDLQANGLIVANLHPGWVKTDMGGAEADLTVEQSIKAMRKTIEALTPDRSGQFLNYDGQIIPW